MCNNAMFQSIYYMLLTLLFCYSLLVSDRAEEVLDLFLYFYNF